MSKIPFRSAYSSHPRFQLDFPDPSRTKQSSQDECDINVLMKKYERDQILPHFNQHQGQYGDFLGIPDYQDALNQIQAASDAFDSLPASVRKRFQNDPGEFIDFAQNPENHDELVKMGLANPKPQPADLVQPINYPPADQQEASGEASKPKSAAPPPSS